jgi:hypothetical protein
MRLPSDGSNVRRPILAAAAPFRGGLADTIETPAPLLHLDDNHLASLRPQIHAAMLFHDTIAP